MDVTINENAVPVPTELDTWGDLLDWLEKDHLKAGQCITRVLIDGHEEINYRLPPICEQSLDAVNDIFVESGDFDRIVRESLVELDQEIQTLLQVHRWYAGNFQHGRTRCCHANRCRYSLPLLATC